MADATAAAAPAHNAGRAPFALDDALTRGATGGEPALGGLVDTFRACGTGGCTLLPPLPTSAATPDVRVHADRDKRAMRQTPAVVVRQLLSDRGMWRAKEGSI